MLPKKTASYSLEMIPTWCRMSQSSHQDGLGGCWGISQGMVAEQGEEWCKPCDLYNKDEVYYELNKWPSSES